MSDSDVYCAVCGWPNTTRWLALAGPDGRWVIACSNPDCDEADL